MDCFGIKKLFPTSYSNNREWFNNWYQGALRSYKFGPAGSNDPEIIFRGAGTYTIYNGLLRMTGDIPRIYVRGSTLETDNLPPDVPLWENVEVTFYVKTTDPGKLLSYAGVCAVVRTNHLPDSLSCSNRGYIAKITFDGRAHFEKECLHGTAYKKVARVYPFTNSGGAMPLNTWIGMKFVCRSCDNNKKCKLEMYMDRTNGLNGGTWDKITEFTDYDGWSSNELSCCTEHKGKVLNPPHMGKNYSVYLRSDGLGEQFYKHFSIREIDCLP